MSNFFERHGDTLMTNATIAFAGLAAIFDQRFDVEEKLITQRFDAQNRRIDDLKADVNRRFDAQGKRIDRLSDEVAELRKLMVGITERVSRNEGEIDGIREQLRIVDTPSP